METIKRKTIREKHIETLDVGNDSRFWKFSKATINGRRETINAPESDPNGEVTTYS
jgi:hypothetical protein